MFIFANLISAVANILDILLDVYTWVVVIAALISWVNPDPYNPVVRFLRAVTEPVFRPVRRLIGYRLGPIDISPLIVILAIIFARRFLIGSLIDIANKMRGGAIL
jgi:YggT family protein